MKNNTRRASRKLPVALKEGVLAKPVLAKAPAPAPVVPLPVDTVPTPKLGSFGVLVLLLDDVASPSSAGALERMGRAWLGREVVFLSALCAPVGAAMAALFPKLFYNADEPLALAAVWRLLPWRVVVVVKAGKICCWSPTANSNVQTPTNESK
ncbi:MAG TPA: hypothetical protein VHP58_01905 [Alphaproteobacteria bacterium]|nr:hypothetical protein [Alphaproteobacteria bacterium]